MVVGRQAHVAKGSQFCPKGVVVEVKGEIVERKGGKQGEGGRPPIFGWPAELGFHSLPTFILHFILLLSCSLYWPKASKVKQLPFILFQSSFYLFLKFIDFILCNDEINMPWNRSK
jgi:hypothetical protein